ncbi:MAG: hypothetical protein LBC20_15540 [Planctomycetaceae bacterium]|jgi:hypothetical protein|nr:hypothetical protein [Planctomycetaceae bacterium]
MNKFNLQKVTYLIFLLFFGDYSDSIFAQTENNKSQKTDSINTADNSDPTMIRANQFIGQKLSSTYLQYQQMRKAFLKNCSREDEIAFNQWENYLITPIRITKWKSEWKEYPESHTAFAIYIRDEIKRNKHLQVEKLKLQLQDETLFRNYLELQESVLHNAEKQAELEQKLGITEELKTAIKNPDLYDFISAVYSYYWHVQHIKKFNAQIKAKEDAAAEARRKIVPVERTSKEYQDAFSIYRQAIEAEKQSIINAEQNDLTWKRAKYLIETKELGTVPNANNLTSEFTNGFDETKIKKFRQWKNGFEILTGFDVTENEWKKEPTSHPAILFCTNIFLIRIQRKEDGESFNLDKVDRKELLKGDKSTLEKYYTILNQKRGIDNAQISTLENELRIPSKLKNAIKDNVSDSTLFLFYDAYFREFTPDEVKKSKQKVSEAIDKLNLLRPNWATEENIEFPDEATQILQQNKSQ